MRLPNPDRSRRTLGLWLLVLALVGGAILLAVQLLLGVVNHPRPDEAVGTMLLGAVLAFPSGAFYLTVPRLLDRYDPEPWYALFGCLAWGALVATSISALVNTCVGTMAAFMLGPAHGTTVAAVLSAPLVEETLKGIGVWGVFHFLRREFDGVVDGVIYATFIALGFATVENVIYYARAAAEGAPVLALTVFLRGLLSPWCHPLFTAMTGIGLGIARESTRPIVRYGAPVLGWSAAVFLHFVWNGTASLGSGELFLLMLPLWLLFVGGFLVLVIVLVGRRGRIIRQHLLDEIALGTLERREVEVAASAFGLLRARIRHGPRGAELVRAIARLALSKWHAARAMQGGTHTVSLDFIVPLRERVRALRAQVRL
ncbi:MAG: PrsW family intramembrane metalloprotease [Myxococcota bacterium]|nr:PrsW family intramembrane metalloprotease [Myxococcota bacterium]MDW8361449.1 PrsW family intramembrane metalloprotease [Myxococcales bacterium]